MSPLASGIKLILSGADMTVAPRYWINYGTMPAVAYPKPLRNYDSAARVPHPEWRVPDVVEEQLLYGDNSAEIGSWISILKMPETLLNPFQAIRQASQAIDIDPLCDLIRTPQIATVIAETKERLAPLMIASDEPMEGGFIFIGYPNKVTLTYAKGPRYIGLHIDSFYQVPLAQRRSSPNRICINLGTGDRFLYFINLPLAELKRRLDQIGSTDPRRHQIGSRLGTAFMERFPDYPVIKLRIAPGEAYIAPTENMIHDGSSLGNCYFDAHLTFRGHFAAEW